MSDAAHLQRLQQGVAAWNSWTRETPGFRVSLYEAELRGANLFGVNLLEAELGSADLRQADLRQANLIGANLLMADLRGARLQEANLSTAELGHANLAGADLRGANLAGAGLCGATLRRADLRGANLWGADLNYTDLTGADLTGCRVHGVSAWGVKVNNETRQQGLVVSAWGEPEVTVDNIEVAQLAWLLLRNGRWRDAIGAVGLIISRLGLGTPGAPARRGKARGAAQRRPEARAEQLKAREIAEPESA